LFYLLYQLADKRLDNLPEF